MARRNQTLRQRQGSRFRAGVIALVLISVLSFFGLTRYNPFHDAFRLDAVFRTASNLRPGSPVRVAGVDVGKVTRVESLRNGTARVRMELEDRALPVHRDAELKVRPRIFLGGNFFVDLHAGSPSAPIVQEGEAIPMAQTAAPVQLGDVLNAAPSGVRRNAQIALRELAKGLDEGGAEGLRQALPYLEPAYRNLALTADAALGEEPDRDLQRALRGTERTAGALAGESQALQGTVTHLNETTGALAAQDSALQASVPALRDTLRSGYPALGTLNAALPSVRTLAREALPGVRRTGPLLSASLPAVRQLRALVRPGELRRTAAVLKRHTPTLVRLLRVAVPLFEQGRAASRCTERVLVPFIESDFPDPDFPQNTGTVNQKLMRSFVGLAGESRTTDANQSFFHTSLVPQPLQVRPAPPPDPTVPPPHRPDVPCETQEAPDLGAPGASLGPGANGGAGLTPFRSGTRARSGGPALGQRRRSLLEARRLLTREHLRRQRRTERLLEEESRR